MLMFMQNIWMRLSATNTEECGGKSAGTSVGFQNGWLDIEQESILLADPVILKRTSDG